jgi:hypothetical protein
MKAKQFIFLGLALVLPIAIFIFLKTFGRNEFNVPPLFTDSVPSIGTGCGLEVSAPYRILPGELDLLKITIDSLACVSFLKDGSRDPLRRVREEYKLEPVEFHQLEQTAYQQKKECIFLLAEPFDVALVDSKGRIRGQYSSQQREEVDRLITEIAIILRKY